jgi:hypothetical protein
VVADILSFVTVLLDEFLHLHSIGTGEEVDDSDDEDELYGYAEDQPYKSRKGMRMDQDSLLLLSRIPRLTRW